MIDDLTEQWLLIYNKWEIIIWRKNPSNYFYFIYFWWIYLFLCNTREIFSNNFLSFFHNHHSQIKGINTIGVLKKTIKKNSAKIWKCYHFKIMDKVFKLYKIYHVLFPFFCSFWYFLWNCSFLKYYFIGKFAQ